MRHARVVSVLMSVVATMLLTLSGETTGQSVTEPVSQPARVIAHSSSSFDGGASLQFLLSNGAWITLTVADGEVTVEHSVGGKTRHEVVTRYSSGGTLETKWRELVRDAGRLDPAEMVAAFEDWKAQALDSAAKQAIQGTPFSDLTAAAVPAPVAPTNIGGRSSASLAAIDSGIAAAIDVLEGLEGLEALKALEALKGLEPLEALEGLEALKDLDELSALDALRVLEQSRIGETQNTRHLGIGSVLGQVGEDILGLVATFIALGALGFGLVFFVPRPLEVVADTVRHSFWRSFFVGLLAQPLVIPLFGMLLLGLALTIVGVLLIPFAIIGFVVAAVLAVLGGYLAVASSIGEVYLRHKMSQGHPVGGWLSYRYIVYGLAALLVLWLPAAVFGWVPFAGDIALASAIILTWMVTTAGFGAAILSRAGIRGTFTRRFDQALSDEYLYQTPHATPVLRSHGQIPRSGA